MTDSLAANEDDLEDRLLEEFLRPGSGGRLSSRVVDGCQLVDVSEIGHFLTLSPPRKTLLLILLLCLKDRATQLRFEPQDSDPGVPGVRMSYVVRGEVYELVPPPTDVSLEIIEEIKELAGLAASREQARGIWGAIADRIASRSTGPSYGGFLVGAGGRTSEVTAKVRPSPLGERVLLQISAVDPALAGIAEESLRGVFADRWGAA